MNIESTVLSICDNMSTSLTPEQMSLLKDTLFVNLHDVSIQNKDTDLIIQDARSEEDKIVEYFYASKLITGRQPSTLQQYMREIKNLKQACGKPLVDITSVDIKWYFGMCRLKRNNSLMTLRNKRNYLNTFYSFLQREGFIKENPVEKVEPIKLDKRLKQAFSVEDLEKMREACTDDLRGRALIEFLLCTGVRVGELCSLDVKDINLNKMEFTVIGKGNKQRICYLNEMGSYHLSKYLEWRLNREKISRIELNERPLFVSLAQPYSRLSKRAIERILTKIGEKAEVPNVHPHRFRRTYASILAVRGCPIQDLKVLMGHSNIDTTTVYCDIKQENINISYRKYNTDI